jgi:hypothetical protein
MAVELGVKFEFVGKLKQIRQKFNRKAKKYNYVIILGTFFANLKSTTSRQAIGTIATA